MEKYVKPEMDVLDLEMEDVILTSCTEDDIFALKKHRKHV